MKKYIDAELQIVKMNNRDIVTESIPVEGTTDSWGEAAGRRDLFDSWYEGY